MKRNPDRCVADDKTVAIEYLFKKIPPDIDSTILRKRIFDAITVLAEEGKPSLFELQEKGLTVLNDVMFPSKNASERGLGAHSIFRETSTRADSGIGNSSLRIWSSGLGRPRK